MNIQKRRVAKKKKKNEQDIKIQRHRLDLSKIIIQKNLILGNKDTGVQTRRRLESALEHANFSLLSK
jgi:hypothetical protein